jgi:hypothetical protein
MGRFCTTWPLSTNQRALNSYRTGLYTLLSSEVEKNLTRCSSVTDYWFLSNPVVFFCWFGSAIPKVHQSDMRLNQGSGGGHCCVPHVGIVDLRTSGPRPAEVGGWYPSAYVDVKANYLTWYTLTILQILVGRWLSIWSNKTWISFAWTR